MVGVDCLKVKLDIDHYQDRAFTESDSRHRQTLVFGVGCHRHLPTVAFRATRSSERKALLLVGNLATGQTNRAYGIVGRECRAPGFIGTLAQRIDTDKRVVQVELFM